MRMLRLLRIVLLVRGVITLFTLWKRGVEADCEVFPHPIKLVSVAACGGVCSFHFFGIVDHYYETESVAVTGVLVPWAMLV